MGRLDGKMGLISGGARGEGAAEAQLFAREGVKVVFGDIRDAEGRQVEAGIGRRRRGDLLHLDVTNEASWGAAVDTAVSHAMGALHVLVNNAAIDIGKDIQDTT